MRRAPVPDRANRVGGILAIAGGVLVVLGCLRHVLRALDAGMTVGRQRAIHSSPEAFYYASIGAGVIGVVLGCCLVRMGWRWLYPKTG